MNRKLGIVIPQGVTLILLLYFCFSKTSLPEFLHLYFSEDPLVFQASPMSFLYHNLFFTSLPPHPFPKREITSSNPQSTFLNPLNTSP